MKKFFIMTLFAFVASVSSAGTHAPFTMKDAKVAAEAYFREETTTYGVKKEDVVKFKRGDSEEYTKDHLKLQMSYIGPGNRFYDIYKGMVAEMEQNPSLQIFHVSLGMGDGDNESETSFIVRLGIENGAVVATVKAD